MSEVKSPSREKIEIPCPICKSNDFRIVFPDTIGDRPPAFGYNFTKDYTLTYRIVQCKNCSHGYASPRPADMSSGYDDNEDMIYLKNEAERISTAQKALAQILPYKNSGRLLDIGCATGDFLQVAQNHFEVEGIELSSWSANIARQKGFRVYDQLLSEFKVTEPYDIITLWAVIEHFENPKSEVEHVARLLKKGGLVCIWTGDLNSITAQLLGKRWWYCLSQHIQMFTEKSLCELFKQCGFKKVHSGLYPRVVSLNLVNDSLQRYPTVSKLLKPILSNPWPWLSKMSFTLKLPGEIFVIFQKE